MLDRSDIDAVVVSTPDHWHALMTIMACAAGKDVYVEKPLTHVLREGEWMLDAARRHRRVVQVGTQQRAGAHYQRARRLLQVGHIGEIRGGARQHGAQHPAGLHRCRSASPCRPRSGTCGWARRRSVPYEPTRGLYHFRWFWDYSGGQTTNLLAHEVDIVQWVTGQVPRRVAAFAQRRSLTGIGETPDVFEGIFEYPGFLLNWSSREVAAGGRDGLEMYGTKGTVAINRRGFEILPGPAADARVADSAIHRTRGGPARPASRCEAVKDVGYEQVRDQFRPHVRNFLDCVKSRQAPLADLESAHQTSIACHLANIAMRTGRVIEWDPARNDIVGDAAASALLTKTYRAPWDQQLRAAMGSA